MFRGREMAHIEEGRKVMNNIIEMLTVAEEIGKLETPPQQNAKRMTCTIAPR